MSPNSGRSMSTSLSRFSGTRIPTEYGPAGPKWFPNKWLPHGTRNVGELLCSVSNDRLDLIPNTTVDVRIQISERPDVLVVPRGAVYIDGSKRFVFRVQDDRLHRRDIKVGIANPTMIEVLSGLQQGDVVALPGEVSLKENLRIYDRCVRNEFPFAICNSGVWAACGLHAAFQPAAAQDRPCRCAA